MNDTLIVEPSKAGQTPSGRKEYRDEQLFARLIGAAVLLAIAVIVLPFVLDGSGSQTEYEYAELLPVEPPPPVVEKSFSSRQTVTPPPSTESFNVQLPETTSLAGLQSAGQDLSNSQNSSPAVTAPVNQGGTNPVQYETIGNNTVTNSALAANSNVSAINYLPLQSGWNIQVASFVRDENAVKLVNRLRAQNLVAYANRVEGKTRTLIRVMVGPYSNQIDVLALQNRIDRDYRVESLVVHRK